MLIRLLLLGDGRTMALMGRGGMTPGEPGGEAISISAVAGVKRAAWALLKGFANRSI
jgi:hypothetical protein